MTTRPLPVCLISVDSKRMTAVLCPWCPDLAAGERFCADFGLTRTHDRCCDCADRHRLEEIEKRESNPPIDPSSAV